MNFESFCRELGWKEGTRWILPESCWNESEKSYPLGAEEEGLFFLQDDFLDKYLAYYGSCREEMAHALKKTASIIRNSSPLRHLAWHLHHVLYRGEIFHTLPGDIPLPPSFSDEDLGNFYRLIHMSCYPLLEKNYEKWGIPHSFAEDIFSTYAPSPSRLANTLHGSYAVRPRSLYWGRLLVEGKIFQVGRLQYEIQEGTIPYGPFLFRGKNGDDRVIAPSRWRYDKNGVRLNDYDEEAVLVTRFEDLGDCYRGRELLKNYRLGEEVTLSKEEYSPLLRQGDLVLDIHIPAGGGMTPEAVKRSLRGALEFFPKYLKREVKLFICSSWILNYRWGELIPESNIAAFQKLGYGYQWPKREGLDGLIFIFGRQDGDPATYPVHTSMQKVMQELYKKEPLRVGGMLLTVERVKEL